MCFTKLDNLSLFISEMDVMLNELKKFGREVKWQKKIWIPQQKAKEYCYNKKKKKIEIQNIKNKKK